MRPSSSLDAKAFTVRSSSFYHLSEIRVRKLLFPLLLKSLVKSSTDRKNHIRYHFLYLLCLLFCVIRFSKNDRGLNPQSRKGNPGQEAFCLYFFLLRKEVIHPHVPVGIPCYDLTPIIGPALDSSLLAVAPPASGIANSHGLTGGVYKPRERIHRGMLIRDY